MTGALVLYLQAGALLALGGLGASLLLRAGPRLLASAPDHWHRVGVIALASCLVLPILTARLASPADHAAPVELWWSGAARPDAAVATVAVPSLAGVPEASPPRAAAPMLLRMEPRTLDVALLAAALVLLAGLVRFALAERRLRRACDSLPLARRIGRVEIRASASGDGPFAARVGRRVVLVVPSVAFEDPRRLRMIVAHEAHHSRKGHLVVARALALLEAAFAWNPGLALWKRALRHLEELACDAAVARRSAFGRAEYARCLLWAAGLPQVPRSSTAPIASMAAAPAAVMRWRLVMLMERPAFSTRRRVAASAACLALLAIASTALGAAVRDHRVDRRSAEAIAAKTPRGGIDVVVDDLVLDALNRRAATPEGRAATRRALARMPDHEPMIEEVLSSRGLPDELLAVVLVESGFHCGVRPDPAGARGVGLWQFIPSTARRYGLVVTELEDERLEPRRSTEAAADFLRDLRERHGSWPLAFAAYYHGDGALEKAIAAGGTRDVMELERRGLLEPYASRVLAAVLVLRDPSLVDG